MKPFIEDMKQPLNKVERGWVRKPVALILYLPMVVTVGIAAGIAGSIDATRRWFTATWW